MLIVHDDQHVVQRGKNDGCRTYRVPIDGHFSLGPVNNQCNNSFFHFYCTYANFTQAYSTRDTDEEMPSPPANHCIIEKQYVFCVIVFFQRLHRVREALKKLKRNIDG